MRKILFAVAIAALVMPVGTQAVTFDSCALFPWQCVNVIEKPVITTDLKVDVQPLPVAIEPTVLDVDLIPDDVIDAIEDIIRDDMLGEGEQVVVPEEDPTPAGNGPVISIAEPSFKAILGLQEEAAGGGEAQVVIPAWMVEVEDSLFGLGIFFGEEEAPADEEAAPAGGQENVSGGVVTQEELDQMEDLLEDYLEQLEQRLDELATGSSLSAEEASEADLIEDRLDLVGKYLERIQVVQEGAEEEDDAEEVESSMKYILIGIIAVLVIALVVLGIILFTKYAKKEVK